MKFISIEVSKESAIKAYKVFNSDWTCRGFQYELGKTYEHKGKVKICDSGFHACEKLADCFSYYDFSACNKVAEVLLWGNVQRSTEGESLKIASSMIEIVREMDWLSVLSLCNTGHSNTGHSNTGCWNTGDRNTGHSNTGCWNTGAFNRITPQYIDVFEKPCLRDTWGKVRKPCFLFFNLTQWINETAMSKQEKKENPNYKTTGGYIKKYTYQQAFYESFKDAKEKSDWKEQLKLLKSLPNFDMDIFCEISGIPKEELV